MAVNAKALVYACVCVQGLCCLRVCDEHCSLTTSVFAGFEQRDSGAPHLYEDVFVCHKDGKRV